MTGAELHQPYLAFSQIDRHRAFEGERRPGQAGNALRVLKQARKAAIFGIPILLAALRYQAMGFRRSDNALRLVGGGPEHSHRVVMRPVSYTHLRAHET